MNVIKLNSTYYKYESLWKSSKKSNKKDSIGNPFPYPVSSKHWYDKDVFLKKLKDLEEYAKAHNRFIKYRKTKKCLYNDKKRVTTGLYTFNRIRWEDGLYHYISTHNIKPSNEFIDFVYKFRSHKISIQRRSYNLSTDMIKSKDLIYLKIDRNQIAIMDALLYHGSYDKKYYDQRKRVYRYSEHAGLLDFDNLSLDKIIISGKTTRVDKGDDEIFMPRNIPEAYDYEYIFHTHPATPKPGGRADGGILYEFPSMSDIFHFIDHYNDGVTQGSIIIAAEGMYNIRKYHMIAKKLKIDENELYKNFTKNNTKIQENAIDKYGIYFSTNYFYSKISHDKKYINKLNEILHYFDLHIDYYPRIKDINNKWIIDDVHIPVRPIELSTKTFDKDR